MTKSAVVRARIEPDLKAQAEAVFERLGINPSQAIAMFYRQVELRNGLPFAIVIPNETTEQTFQSTDGGHGLVRCNGEDDLFANLGI